MTERRKNPRNHKRWNCRTVENPPKSLKTESQNGVNSIIQKRLGDLRGKFHLQVAACCLSPSNLSRTWHVLDVMFRLTAISFGSTEIYTAFSQLSVS